MGISCFTKENRYLCNVVHGRALVSCLHSTSQSLSPKTAYAILLAPLLHHPRLELISDDFPFVDLWSRILFLAALRFGLGLQTFDLKPQTLSIQPSCEIFEHNRVIQ